MGGAIGTAVPIPGVGSTLGTVVGGVASLFGGGKRTPANESFQAIYETVFADLLGSGAVRALGDTTRGSGTVRLEGRFKREDVEPILEAVKEDIIAQSCADGGCGRNAASARALRLVRGEPVPGTGRMANRDLSIVIFQEPTRVDSNGNQTDEQTGAGNGGVRAGGSGPGLAGLAALAAGLFIFS